LEAGAALYAQYCASCHGVNLEGAPDWKISLPDGSLPPPPQDSSGHTWHHPDPLLLDIVANGGDPAYNSRMPAFGDQISKDEMISILDFIKSTWGKDEREFQWWMTVTQGNP
jgi:mono/diheme cytochrome c family protein